MAVGRPAPQDGAPAGTPRVPVDNRDRIGEVLGPNGRAPVIGAPARRAAAKDRSPQP